MNFRIAIPGPFDIIGDVHGCYDELLVLLKRLGYHVGERGGRMALAHSEGRRVIFLGDLVDRGPKVPEVLHLVMDAVGAGAALCVAGNHDNKLLRKLRGRNVQVTHGLAESLAQLEALPAGFTQKVVDFLDTLPSHYLLDGDRLVVVHAGLREHMQGRDSEAIRAFSMYGATTGKYDEYGLPERLDWSADYRGQALVVYGHTPVAAPRWNNNTLCIDTGCVFGGALTALRYPERELVAVPAAKVYYAPTRPLR